MADVFGASIYVFVSRSLFTFRNKIRSSDGIGKDDKFRAMAVAVADELLDLLKICETSYTYVVQPILKPLIHGSSMEQPSRDLRILGLRWLQTGI